MTRRLTTLLAFAAALACANAAEAGFVAVGLEDTAIAVDSPREATGSGATDETPQPPAPQNEFRLRDSALQTGGGGMTTSAHGGSNSPPATPALAAVEVDTSAQLTARLCFERAGWVPPPFLSGVFRPPRD